MNPYIIDLPTILRIKNGKFQNGEVSTDSRTGELTREISWSESDVWRAFYAYGQNLDPVVRQKGMKIYQEMMEDDQVKASIELRKQARLSTPWEIHSGEDGNALADEMADFIRHVFKRLQGTFEDNLYEIYSAIEYGFSVSELVYEVIPDGLFSGKVGLRAIKTREPFNYDFKTDFHGNLLGIVYTGSAPLGQEIDSPRVTLPSVGRIIQPGTLSIGTLENPFPPDKFVIYSYNSQFGNPYGRSDLLAAYRSWLVKKHIVKFWSIWLERYASPFIWAQYKTEAGLKKDALEEIDNFIRNLSARQGIRVPDSVTINPVQFSTAGGDAYEKAVEAHNRFISHAILCPNLLGYTQQSTVGSYALGKKHFDAFVWILEKAGRDTSESIVGEQIIKRLIRMNYSNVDDDLMPSFKFEGIEEESIEARARIVTMLASGGFIGREESWVRDFLTIPRKDPDIVLSPIRVGDQSQQDDERDDERDDSKEDHNEMLDSRSTGKFVAVNKEINREPNQFERKMNVKRFEANLDSGQDQFFSDLSGIMQVVRDSVITQVIKKEIIESGDPKIVERIAVNIGDLKDSIRQWLVKFHLDAKLGALEELGRAGVEVEITRNFQDVDAPFEPWAPLPPREAVEFFNRKVKARIVTKAGEKKLVTLGTGREMKFYDEKAFAVSGVVRDDILGDVKQVLLNGIKRQDRAGAIKDLKSVFNKYVEAGIAVDDELLAPHRLQTIARTNMVEAVNEGRRAMYEDKDVEGFVEFWEYTAILDGRTTDYCRCMDGKVFRMEDISILNPPAHYNCRSFSVPVTKFEVDDLRKVGKGVEVSEPCPERASGFQEHSRGATPIVDRNPSAVPGIANVRAVMKPVEDLPAASRSIADVAATDRVRNELASLIVRCPYSWCGSDDIRETGRNLNVTEFECGMCGLPFKVSSEGDLYLYDAGSDEWEKFSMGAFPAPVGDRTTPAAVARPKKPVVRDLPAAPRSAMDIAATERLKNELSGIVARCPYRFCHSDKIVFVRKIFNVGEFKCEACGFPFRLSNQGNLYLYDAGMDAWHKINAGMYRHFSRRD